MTASVNVVVEEAGIEVESVSAISTTDVDVTIEALEEDTDDVTIEVLDNNGEVVEVKPITIAAGDTTASFDFVKEVEKQEGVWTIGGVQYDFDLLANLSAVYNAKDEVKLLSALNEIGLDNVKAENITEYDEALSKLKNEVDEKDFTKEVAQKLVNDVNKELLTAEEEAAVVKSVNEAKMQVALLNALRDGGFERVNADWISSYDSKITDEEDSIDGIQTKVNEVNNTKLPTVNAEEVNSKTLNNAKDLIGTYATPNEDGNQTDDTIAVLKAIDVQLAVVDVRNATTPNRLTVAINKLASVVDDEEILDQEDYNAANAKAYFEGLNDAKGIKDADVKTVAHVNTVITGINTEIEKDTNEKEATLVTKVQEAADADELLIALKALGLENVVDANKAKYAEANYDSATKKSDVQSIVKDVNDAVSGIVSNADELKAALENDDLDTITLEKDVVYTDTITLDKDVTLDGNGNTLYINTEGKGDHSAQGLYIPADAENVVVEDITITTATHGDNLIEISGDATLNGVTAIGGDKLVSMYIMKVQIQ